MADLGLAGFEGDVAKKLPHARPEKSLTPFPCHVACLIKMASDCVFEQSLAELFTGLIRPGLSSS